jgi:hypothetical protein
MGYQINPFSLDFKEKSYFSLFSGIMLSSNNLAVLTIGAVRRVSIAIAV